MKKIDYDAIAGQYSRHRRIHPGVLRSLLEKMPLTGAHAVLEVGCGTGNYILALQAAAGCKCWGIDPSAEMLAIARERNGEVTLQQGAAEKIPHPNAAFDLVFSVDVIHHVQEKGQYIQEAFRLLAGNGWFCTVTESEDLIRERIPLASYFPETVEPQIARYPRIESLAAWMQTAGFSKIEQEIVRWPYEISDLGAFEDKAFSSLHLISEDAFQCGLARLRDDLKRGPIPAVSHYLLHWGHKPVDQSNQ